MILLIESFHFSVDSFLLLSGALWRNIWSWRSVLSLKTFSLFKLPVFDMPLYIIFQIRSIFFIDNLDFTLCTFSLCLSQFFFLLDFEHPDIVRIIRHNRYDPKCVSQNICYATFCHVIWIFGIFFKYLIDIFIFKAFTFSFKTLSTFTFTTFLLTLLLCFFRLFCSDLRGLIL